MVKSAKTVAPERPPVVEFMNRRELAEHVGNLIAHDRNETHGDPTEQFATAQQLKSVMHNTPNALGGPQAFLNSTQREAIDQICTKLSRAGHGKFTRDVFIDIAGYAVIAAEATK